MDKVVQQVVKPTIDGLYKEGLVYKGFVFFGLINVGGEPFVIEYNCRMGDPETEVVMPRLSSDLVELMLKMEKGELEGAQVHIDQRAAATVVLVSGGYPGDFEKGKKIDGLTATYNEGTQIFFAGISAKNGELETSGGRVAAVTSYGKSIADAVASSIEAIEKIEFEGMAFRRDIGYEFKN
jgi:phosphoribosylamine--glycine ligase